MKLHSFLVRKILFSRATFGPKQSPRGVLKHLQKELIEVEQALDEADLFKTAQEAVDCIFLGIDILWRACTGHTTPFCEDVDDLADLCEGFIRDKLKAVEKREWPDWRTLSEDSPIEHIRETEISNELVIGGYYADRKHRAYGPILFNADNEVYCRCDHNGRTWTKDGKSHATQLISDFDLIRFLGTAPSKL